MLIRPIHSQTMDHRANCLFFMQLRFEGGFPGISFLNQTIPFSQQCHSHAIGETNSQIGQSHLPLLFHPQ